MTLEELKKLNRKQLDAEKAGCFRGSTRDGMVAAELTRRDRRWNRWVTALGFGIGLVSVVVKLFG